MCTGIVGTMAHCFSAGFLA